MMRKLSLRALGLILIASTSLAFTPVNTPTAELEEAVTCYITPLIVQSGSCGSGYYYKTYASAGTNVVNYNRTVSIAVIDGMNILEGKVVTIPAGQHLSNQLPILQNTTQSYSSITLRVVDVSPNGGCVWRQITPSINNCYFSGGGDIGGGFGE